MHISPVTLSNLVCHSSPPALVNFSEMGLVLGVDNPDGIAACDDDVGHQMAQRAMARVRPVERRHRLTAAAEPQQSTFLANPLANLCGTWSSQSWSNGKDQARPSI